MNSNEIMLLKNKIDKAKLVSFDIFDTLLFRKTNTPETVFDLVGRNFGIHGFRKLRIDRQHEASRRQYRQFAYPHADMDRIYEVLGENTDIPVDWQKVKQFEIQLEMDALVANRDMLEIYQYAKSKGKRVVATSDMYLFAATLYEALAKNGYADIDHVYCSADEHKAKFNRDLFELVRQKENLPYRAILHIGDKDRDDGEFPSAYGMDTFVYHHAGEMDKVKNVSGSDVDNGLYKILYDDEKGFWYNLGLEVGGPMYMGLYRYVLEKTKNCDKKIYFLSRDGYNLYHIFRRNGFDNTEYLYTSRRALLMASVTEMNDEDIASLPPYTFGQTVGEVLDYLGVCRDEITTLEQVGFSSFDDVIATEENIKAFRRLYVLDKDVFLRYCADERKNALAYFDSIGFFDADSVCFDCGWQGSSQVLIEKFKKAVNKDTQQYFIYFGIKNGEKSFRQMRGKDYSAYLFDFYRNYALQYDIARDMNVALYELFFSAPHESVYRYGENGTVIFEEGRGEKEKQDMLEGIYDFISVGIDFVEKYNVEYTPDNAVAHLVRLINKPTEKEAVKIGNLRNVDGFARKNGEEKYIAYITSQQIKDNPHTEVYWPVGVLKRSDITNDVKAHVAALFGIQFPQNDTGYHLEDERVIRNYNRWLNNHAAPSQEKSLDYTPRFSVVIPVYNTATDQLEECINSVLNQTYGNFELIMVDDHSSWDNVVPVLKKYESDERVKVIYRTTNGHISVATNDGINIATGDYIVFMDCDDTIEPHALYEFALKLNENPQLDFIYSDDNKITEDGTIRHMPFFKPDWSPDLFMTMMYTNHLAVYRTSIVKEAGGLRTAYNGSQDYDFTLRFMEKSDNSKVGHIPQVLYNWRERKESVAYAMNSKNYAAEASCCAKEDYIRRNGLDAFMEYIPGLSQYRIVYNVKDDPLVSIIIPSKDHPDILRQCIDSIKKYTAYSNYEIIVVDNGSDDENKKIISDYLDKQGVEYIYKAEKFNFSAMCNRGAQTAKGEYLLFLNDDIEIFMPHWLERMLGHAQQPHAGAVGAKLYYPNSTMIQHTGVTNSPSYGPVHSFMNLNDMTPYYFGLNWADYNAIAVTGACLMVGRDKFYRVGGFDENLPVAYNDVKLCFALHRNGWYNVVRNDVVAYHHESLSRGTDQADDAKLIRLYREKAELFAAFPELDGRDPYLNENLNFYGEALRMKKDCDILSPVDVSGCKQLKNGEIDFINIADKVQIIGWALSEDENSLSVVRRFVIFKDVYGRTYSAQTVPRSRPDVARHFGRPDFYYAGFESLISKKQLRVDIMSYTAGIMLVDRNGRRFVKWCKETGVVRNPKPRPVSLPYRKIDFKPSVAGAAKTKWFVDWCGYETPCHRIAGFAFRTGGQHYLYNRTIILTDSDGNAYEFDTHPDERLDVAYTFPKEHYLYYTGFICYIYDGMLPSGREYHMTIRLTNTVDQNDVIDIHTGHIVKQH
ncbi:MAG: glycosyltransferase [Oscillospiraceae bacterium]|nr:glycosyltransferase [Oscillospiraceae bacterium]